MHSLPDFYNKNNYIEGDAPNDNISDSLRNLSFGAVI